MEQNPPEEANSISALFWFIQLCEEIHSILRTAKFASSCLQSARQLSLPSAIQPNPAYVLKPYSLKTHFNIIPLLPPLPNSRLRPGLSLSGTSTSIKLIRDFVVYQIKHVCWF